MKNGLIKVSVFYPFSEGKIFNMDYYLKSHSNLLKETMGDFLKGLSVDKGLAGLEPGSAPAYFAVGNLYFDSMESLQGAFSRAQILMADIPNFTDTEPLIQVSQVVSQEYPLVSTPSLTTVQN